MSILIFLVLFFCCTCDGLANGTISSQPHPYFVTLVTPRLCGGVLISLAPEAWVLTAAHCVYSEEEQEHTIDATLYDLALIRLDHAITTSTTSINNDPYSSIYYNSIGQLHNNNRPPDVQSIPIATTNTTNNTISSSTECMGMGATTLEPGSESTQLMRANCQPTNDNHTIGIFSPYLNTVQVVQFPSSAVLCHGDSGGPLVMKNNQVDYISGILSRILYAYDPNPDQPTCPVPESPDDLPMANVFVKPEFHLPWISQVTGLSIAYLTTPSSSSSLTPSSSYFDILHYSRAPVTLSPFVGWIGLVSLCSYFLS
ncbi:unnamed protein product [Absidia cylindrospora]